jgi:hypothetical protein
MVFITGEITRDGLLSPALSSLFGEEREFAR